MTHRPCVVIPTYNNPLTIEKVSRTVADLGLPVIVVDDGGNAAAQEACDRAAKHPGVTLVRRQTNGGKGAAVKTGLQSANELGFTHALQVDADGQHNFEDIPRFLQASRDNPEHLILGYPVFDDSVPKSRLMARQLSIFWVNLETFGPKITDPLCGFRVYPISAALRVHVRGERMDFDPEIAVRMVWDGTLVLNLNTKVRYLTAEEGGVSHFQLFRDNVRISWMHTRLVVEGILRMLTWPARLLLGRTGGA